MLCLFFSVLRGEFDIHALFFVDKKQSFTPKAYSTPGRVWRKGWGGGGVEGGGRAGGVWGLSEGLAFRSFIFHSATFSFAFL